jgi:hypothetical protein
MLKTLTFHASSIARSGMPSVDGHSAIWCMGANSSPHPAFGHLLPAGGEKECTGAVSELGKADALHDYRESASREVLLDALLPASRGEGGRRACPVLDTGPDEGKALSTSTEWHCAISGVPVGIAPPADQIFTSSTRRFFARPASSALSAKGLSEPKPLELKRDGSTPKPTKAPSTLRARSVDS